MNDLVKIQALLEDKADCQARLNLLPYDGSPEIKEQNGSRYLYVRKRIAGKLTSTYVDAYSDELYQLLLKNAKDARVLRKRIRQIERELTSLGYKDSELSSRVLQNIDFARANMKSNIYDQAVLEGVGTTFPQTEEILNNGIVNGVKASDVQKILNLKHAWEFILNKNVILNKTDYSILCMINKLVEEGFYYSPGILRTTPVKIGGTTWSPELPDEATIKEKISEILESNNDDVDKAIELLLFVVKTQAFIDGNKRTSVIFANHFLIGKGKGIIVIPVENVEEYKSLLIKYYETDDNTDIKKFLITNCYFKI